MRKLDNFAALWSEDLRKCTKDRLKRSKMLDGLYKSEGVPVENLTHMLIL